MHNCFCVAVMPQRNAYQFHGSGLRKVMHVTPLITHVHANAGRELKTLVHTENFTIVSSLQFKRRNAWKLL